MADKNLSELEWRKFAKGRDLKDAAFVKALAALEKAKAADQQLEALADIEKQADVLRKAGKGDKELASYLGDLDKAVDKQRKLSEFEARKAAQQSAGDDEEESPGALTKQMVPLLRQIPKGGEFPVLLAITSKEVAVLVSKRTISPSKRKLLADHLGVSGGVKYAVGHCLFEENAYTFVMQTEAAGLAKKLKAALLSQTELRLKVRVRGEDPADIDDDGEEGEEGGTEAESQESSTEAQTSGETAVDPLKAQFETRLEALEPRVLAALKAQAGDVSKIRAVAEFVRGKGEEGNYKAGLQGMDSLVKLLDTTGGIPPAPPLPTGKPAANAPAAPQDPQSVAFNARLAALMIKLKEATALGAPAAQDAKLQISEAGMSARKKEFPRANQLLDIAEAALASVQPDRGDWDRRLADIEPDYLAVLKKNPPDATKLRAVMAFAQEAAEGDQFGKAIGALAQLRKLVDAARPPVETSGQESESEEGAGGGRANAETGYKGLVSYRKTLLELRAAVSKVEGQIASLLKAIPQQMPDEADLAEELADHLRDANEELQDLVDDAMNSAENEDTPITRALAQRLDALIDEVTTDDVIKHVDANPFGVSLNIAETLGKALSAVRNASPIPA